MAMRETEMARIPRGGGTTSARCCSRPEVRRLVQCLKVCILLGDRYELGTGQSQVLTGAVKKMKEQSVVE